VVIVVLRHGKPNIDTSGKVNSIEFGEWVSRYDKSGICESSRPDEKIVAKAKKCHFVVCSHLPRSIESAKLLGVSNPHLVSSAFREFEMPYGKLAYPTLSISAWSLVFRLFQMAGYSFKSESYKEAKERSIACANELAGLANNHESVLFVGHGTLNWLLHKQLLRMGWSCSKKSPKNHWEFTEYKYNETEQAQ